MNNRKNRTCASCREFPITNAMERGAATCGAYGNQVAWDDHFCVLYMPAPDSASRTPLVRKLMEQEKYKLDGGL